MREFFYQGVDKTGSRVDGHFQAEGEADLRMALRAQGIRPTKIIQNNSVSSFFSNSHGPKNLIERLELTVPFVRKLAFFLESGMRDHQALNLIEETATGPTKRLIFSLRSKMTDGNSLVRAIEQHPKFFPKVLRTGIQSVTDSAELGKRLLAYGDTMEKTLQERRKLRSMLFRLELTVSCAVITVLIASRGKPWTGLLVGLAILTPLVLLLLFRTTQIKSAITAILYHIPGIGRIPGFGNLTQRIQVVTLFRNFSFLTSLGIEPVAAIEACRWDAESPQLADAIWKIRYHLEKGKPLTVGMARSEILPRWLIELIRQVSGLNDAKIFRRGSEIIAEEIEAILDRGVKILDYVVLVSAGLSIFYWIEIIKRGLS